MEKRESIMFSVLLLPLDMESCISRIRLEDYEPLPLSPIFLSLSSAAGDPPVTTSSMLLWKDSRGDAARSSLQSNWDHSEPPCALGLLQVPPTTLFLPVHSCPTAFLQP